jgi:uncharacterized membrane protein YdjX (TVP38/TMEM64 family)
MRLLWLVLALALLVIVPFAIWGGDFEQWLSLDRSVASLRACGAWGWLWVIALLVGDLFLPIPATPVMSAAGFVYGFWLGGLLSAAGTFLAGMLAYGLCRLLGHHAAERIVGREDLARGQRLLAQRGAWLVAISRALPVLPEVVSCLAGLTRMPLRTFAVALACGSIPMGWIYAGIGAFGTQEPLAALLLSALAPVILWLIARRWADRK